MIKLGCYISLFFTLASCVIEDDIPYPVVDGAILSMEVEGQRAGEDGQSAEATINNTDRTVTLFVILRLVCILRISLLQALPRWIASLLPLIHE